MSLKIRRVAVVGAGTMGHGIAQAMASAGWETRLTDAQPESLSRALAAIRRNLEGAVSRGKMAIDVREQIQARIAPEETLAAACRDADLIVEAVIEDLDVKRAVLKAA